MKRSTEHVLTTHTGSLPRPSELLEALQRRDRGESNGAVLEDLPEGKVLIPGLVDSTTNYVEHPELVAQRITRYAQLVGRENVIAGSDCGFATFASFLAIDPGITWAKLGAMAEGARIASESLW